jgi:hypothetical protein
VSRSSLSLTEVLDDAGDVIPRVAAPFVGVLWLTGLPLRLAQAQFVAHLIALKGEAAHFGDALWRLALVAGGAFVLAAWGRAVYVRACGFGLRGAVPGRASFRVRPAAFAAYLYVALLLEAVFYATAWTVVLAPFLVLLAALAAATSPFHERASLWAPLGQLFRHGRHAGVLLGMLVVFAAGLLVMLLNLYFAFRFGLWLAGAVPGLDPGTWDLRLRFGNPRFVLMLVAGAGMALEPYWLAAAAVYVHKVRSRGSGEDLRLWFERLRQRDSEAAA